MGGEAGGVAASIGFRQAVGRGGVFGGQLAEPLLFLGLIAGQLTAAGFWLVIDYFTGMTDNKIYWVNEIFSLGKSLIIT